MIEFVLAALLATTAAPLAAAAPASASAVDAGSDGAAFADAPPVVVLLHGLARSPASMRPMAKALESAGWRVCNIGYPSTTQAIPDDDGKVSVASARLEGMRDFLVVPVSHPFLMRDEAVIAQTLRYLREGGFEHPPVEPEPPAIPGEVAAGDGEASWRTLLGGAAYTPAQRVPRRVPDDATDTDDGAPRPPFVDDGDAAGAGFVPVVALTLRRDDREVRSVLAGDTLAIADAAPAYRLHDALVVRTDPGGYPSLAGGWLAPDGTAFVLVVNAHFNSQEGFAAHTLYALRDGVLATVWDGPLLYSLGTGDDGCDPHRIVRSLHRFTPATDTAWPDIDVVLRETRSCGEVATGSSDVATTLHFDPAAGRYAARD